MEIISFILRIIIGVTFLFSAVSKINHFSKFIVIVKNYRLIPERFVYNISYLIIIGELTASILVTVSYMQMIGNILIILLLLCFIYGIITNLVKGRTAISCGCGGILEEQSLSWSLVFRNMVFITVNIFLLLHPSLLASIDYYKETGLYVMDIEVVRYLIIASVIIIVYVSVTSLLRINNTLKIIMKEV